jgi:hypothetical protein
MNETDGHTADLNLSVPDTRSALKRLWWDEGVTFGTAVHLNPNLMRDALVRRGLDVTTFAESADVCAGTLYRVLAGHPIRMHTVTKIARSLNRLPILDGVGERLGGRTQGPLLVRAADGKELA